MTDTVVRGPERPRHIDARITRISLEDLALAIGLDPAGPALTVAGIRARLTVRRPVWDLADWTRGARGTPAAEEVIEAANTLVRDGIDVTGAGEGRSRLYGFHYLRWLDPLPRAYLLTGDAQYARTFSQLLRDWEAARDSLQGQWPGLDVVWYSLGCWCRSVVLLPALHAFGDALDDDAWLTTVTTLLGGARWIHDEHTAFRHGNWQLVAATQLLHLAMVIPGLVEAPAWQGRALDRIQEHLALDFYPDGAHYERSPGYHQMCLRNLQIAAAADREYGEGTLVADPRLRSAHQWIEAMTSTAGWAPAFQDSPVEWPGDVLLRGAWLLEDPVLLHHAHTLMPADLFAREVQMLPAPGAEWVRAALATGNPPVAAGSRTLPDSGYTLLRTGTNVAELRATINHGPHIEHELESHSHDAVLDFVLEQGGAPLLWEAGGPPNYDDPHYLSWFQAAAGHNAVSLDGVELDQERRVTGRLLEGAGFSVFLGTQHGYGIPQHRTLVLVPVTQQPFLLLRDRADLPDAQRDVSFSQRLHAPSPWQRACGDSASSIDARSASDTWSAGTLSASILRAETGLSEPLGAARLPAAEYGQAPYKELSTLHARNHTGAFDTLLVPHDRHTPSDGLSGHTGAGDRPGGANRPSEADQPGESDRPEAPQLPALRTERDAATSLGDDAVVETAEGTVRLGAHSVLFRSHLEDLLRVLAWDVQRVGERADELVTASMPVDLALEREGDRFSVTVTTGGRCTITLARPVRSLQLDGVEVEAPNPALTLPYAGTWTVTGRHG